MPTACIVSDQHRHGLTTRVFFVPHVFTIITQGRSSMKPNIYAIMAECIQRGVTAGLRRYDIENVLLQGDIESAIWLELDSFFTFDEEK